MIYRLGEGVIHFVFREEAIRILKRVAVAMGFTSLPLMVKLLKCVGPFIKEAPEATSCVCIHQRLLAIGAWGARWPACSILSTRSLIVNVVAAPPCFAVAVMALVTVINLRSNITFQRRFIQNPNSCLPLKSPKI